ncbi:MAG: SDR family NAD(P)-dependent oxidoreductase [Phycisphaeraceae bacterium]
MPRLLTDKVLFITGASSGIGEATARAAAAAGMHVALFARREDKLRQLAADLETLGRRALVLPGDVTQPDDLAAAFDATWQTFHRLDAAFANAGYGLCVPMLDLTDEQHHAIFQTNYFATIHTLQRATPLLKRTPAGLRHLLVCSSAASEIGLPFYGAYAATKAAQDAAAGALRAELADEQIHVTTVHPIGTTSEFFATVGQRSNRTFDHDTPNTPAFLAQTPDHVARAIVKALRRPRPEVWPFWPVRFGLALGTAFPRFAAWAMRRHYRQGAGERP